MIPLRSLFKVARDNARHYKSGVFLTKEYEVTVGIGNQEEGPATYRVTFSDASCDEASAQVCKVADDNSCN